MPVAGYRDSSSRGLFLWSLETEYDKRFAFRPRANLHSGLSPFIRFIARHLLSLVLIALALVLGKLAMEEVRTLQAARNDRVTLARIDGQVAEFSRAESAAASERVAGYRAMPLAALDARIAAIETTLRAPAPPEPPLLEFPLPQSGQIAERLATGYTRKIATELARQELAHLEQLRAYLHAGQGKEGARQRLELLRAAHVEAYVRYREHLQEYAQLGWMERQLVDSTRIRTPRLAALETERLRLAGDNARAYAAFQAQQRAIARLAAIKAAQPFAVDQARLAALAAPLREHLARADAMVAQNLVSRLWMPIAQALPAAAMILALAFFGHLLVKALFYFVLAPLATRLQPVCLDRQDSGQLACGASAVSQSVRLEPDQQLLVLPDYVQSSPAASDTRTKWLMDWSFPWTSLVSGMVALTSIKTKSGEPVVLSASEDPLSEIVQITLPAGSAMVFQPRCLVGVVYTTASPLRITSHWRQGSLHAWLTLQLRYLAFHGPVTLVVKGSRGVRVEPAGKGRLISQASTLGFSAAVEYSTVRCETFFPYYQGKTALLQDRFEGATGYYVYDETPRGGKQGNAVARGLEGLSDAVLKVFGI